MDILINFLNCNLCRWLVIWRQHRNNYAKQKLQTILMKQRNNIDENRQRHAAKVAVPYGGRWSSFQVHWLEDQVRRRRQLNNLSTHQAQFLVVIKHSVHVLDPDGIHRTIKDQPLPVQRLSTERLAVSVFDTDSKLFACSKNKNHCQNHYVTTASDR